MKDDPEMTYVIRKANDLDIEHLLANSNYSPKGIEMITKNGGWIVQYHESRYLVIPDYDKTADPETYLLFKIKDHYTYTGVAYKGSDISNAVTKWDLINGLKGSAKDTWEDILS